MTYDVWFFRYGVHWTECFVILDYLGDIIVLHKCTNNYDQMMYSSWDMVYHRCNCYFSFWANFCLFTFLTARKIKILKKWKKKKPGDIIILHMCTKNYDQMMYGSWDIMCDRCNYFSFWSIFYSLTSVTCKKIKIFEKTWSMFHYLDNYIWLYRLILELCWVWWNVMVVWLY